MVTNPAPVHGGDVLAAAARWGLSPREILDFSANINPFGPPAAAVVAARAALSNAAAYPEPHARTLRVALAHRHGVSPASVLVGNGAAEVIHLLLRQAAGRKVAVPAPGFAEYARAARAVGAEVLPMAPGGPVPPDLEPGDMAILCNPHNPTGLLIKPEQVLEIHAATRATLLIDEAFIDLTDPGEAASVLTEAELRENLVVIRSLTKFYALPGLRVGYAVTRPDLIARLDAVRDPWSVSAVASAAALAALGDQAYAERTRAWIKQERPFLAASLAAIPGYAVEPPSANFILVKAPEPAWQIAERLGPKGIMIRDCRSFEGLTEHHMRLAVRSREENLRLLEALRT